MTRTTLLLASQLLTLTACASAVQPSAPVDDLEPIAAYAAGLDTVRLQSLLQRIRSNQIPDIHSLLVVRRGRLAVEEYFQGWHRDSLHTLQSVSKSVTSALVGIALDRGVFRSTDERVVDFYPALRDSLSADPRRAAQRIEDILTMRTGTDYDEGSPGSAHSQLNALATGWDLFWLHRPMRFAPGTTWRYDSGGVITLSSLFKARTGAHADTYATEHLFAPLGITRWRWYTNQEGHPHLGGGLFLRPLDMARFGQLYLQRGRWGARQIVPADWVDASLTAHEPFVPPRRRMTGYGYLWWRLPPAPTATQDMWMAAGNRGQFVVLAPEYDLVVVVTAGAALNDAMWAPIEFLYSDILPAVQPR